MNKYGVGVFVAIALLFLAFDQSEKFDFLPAHNGAEELVHHKAYVLAYNEPYEQPSWVAYSLNRLQVAGSGEERSDNFREDPSIKTGSASPDDYKKSGYDRGHLCPAGDMGFDAEAMSESFYMSNMSPQLPAFNRGIWKKLETAVRNWAVRDDELYVVAGPILHPQLPTIGANKVAVPELYFKVVLDYRHPDYKAIGFVMPNAGSKSSIYHFAVSVDSVEKLSGLDFFPALPDSLENQLEANFDTILWKKH